MQKKWDPLLLRKNKQNSSKKKNNERQNDSKILMRFLVLFNPLKMYNIRLKNFSKSIQDI